MGLLNRADSIKIFKDISNIIVNNELGSKFRARSREVPILIDEHGFITTLIFLFAKTKGDYEDILKEYIKKGKTIEKSKDSYAYSLYLYAILEGLKVAGIIGEEDVENPVEAIKKLLGDELFKPQYAYLVIKDYLLDIKRLAEALYG